jgi:monofunctional biosynthetic peptidoglycan transglycosylase
MTQPSLARRAARFLLRVLIIFVVGSLVWVGIYRFVPPPITATMLANAIDGRGINKAWMPLDRMSPNMPRAAIAAEDGNFCKHHGFDFKAIQKAMESNFEGDKRIRGGSTISQQTAKNAFLWQNGGYVRKAFEAWFTVLIETLWPKKRIIEVYLNIAETGIGTYGANAGAMRYFHHDASQLSRAEAARIAAVLPLPKKREAISPTGFTRRYGDRIGVRMGQVHRFGQDDCLS